MPVFGISEGQKKTPPSAPTVESQSDSGSGRDFDNGAASVTFTRSTYSGKLPIIGYVITATSEDGLSVVTSEVTNLTSFVLTGLKSGKKYKYKVKARNAVYDSPDSSEFGPAIATTKPSAPTSVGATDLANSGGATISWVAPANGGSSITKYIVTPSSGIPFDNTSTTATVSGLTLGGSYTYTVAAVNANGTGPSSTPSNQITITAAPVVTPPSTGGGGPAPIVEPTPTTGTTPPVATTPTYPKQICYTEVGVCCGVSGPVAKCYYLYADGSTSNAVPQCGTCPPSTTTTPAPTCSVGASCAPTVNGVGGYTQYNYNANCACVGTFVTLTYTPSTGVTSSTSPPASTVAAVPPPSQPWFCYYYSGPPPGSYGPPTAPRPTKTYCLDVNTYIPTPSGDRKLADLQVGDVVLSAKFKEIDPNDPDADLIVDTWSSDALTFEELTTTTIVALREYDDKGQYVINGRIKVTASHPFISKDKHDGRFYYTRAASLIVGDLLFDGEIEEWIEIENIDIDPNFRFTVRTLSTEPYDMFFAEGILVHNK
jgi:hypothetical protein